MTQSKIKILRKQINEEDARNNFENKKTESFGNVFNRPKKDQVTISDLTIHYEVILLIHVKYSANYFQKKTHKITVGKNVREIVINDNIFPIKQKSKLIKTIGLSNNNKIELKLEEHIFVETEKKIAFDINGKEIKFPYRIDEEMLEQNNSNIVESGIKIIDSKITPQYGIDKAYAKCIPKTKKDVRDFTQQRQTVQVDKIYVPIYEARLTGPERKVEILRLDAVLKKII